MSDGISDGMRAVDASLRPTHVKSGGCWTAMRHYYGQWCIIGNGGVEFPAPIHKYQRVVLT